VWLAGAFFVGSAIGGAAGGVVIGTVSGIVAAFAVGIGLVVRGAKRTATALDGPAPDIRGLEPKQALAVLGSVASGAGANMLDLESPQGRAVEEIRELAERAPPEALTLAHEQARRFPRSGLVRSELARQLLASGDDAVAAQTAGEAIQLALDGGSNPLAARLLVEFFAHRDALGLQPASLRRLAGAAEAGGHHEAAAWCRGGAEPG
jgi:hypothetical protein